MNSASPVFGRRTAARAAAAAFVAASHANAPAAGLLSLARIETAYGLDGVRDLGAAVLLTLSGTCPTHLRTSHGSPDLALLVPGLDDSFEVLAGAARLATAEDRAAPDASDISRVEDSVASAVSVRPVLQAALDAITEQQHDDTACHLAARRVFAPLERPDVIAAFPLLAIAVRAAAPATGSLQDSP